MQTQTVELHPNMELGVKLHLDILVKDVIDLFPESVRDELSKELYIAGGAIVSYLQGEPIHDYDLFCKTERGVQIVSQFENSFGSDAYLRNITKNAITLQVRENSPPVQIITRFHGTPDRVFTSFDFEHCKCFYDPSTGQLSYNKDLIINKNLVYTGEDAYPVNALSRMAKYVKRGYTIDKNSILNLAVKLSRTNLDDENVRREQLIGFYGSSLE